VWVCDIEEGPLDEGDCDFLFFADISSDGAVTSQVKHGKAIFQDSMYDIQEFTADTADDGKLDFKFNFGKNTKERRECPDGWEVQFRSLEKTGADSYQGRIYTSWWGERNVRLKSYISLSDEERKKYPDMVAHYKKTVAPGGDELQLSEMTIQKGLDDLQLKLGK
jgi:hypothetical protein